MGVIGFWYNNARPKALPQSMLPAVLAVCMAAGSPGFSLSLASMAVAGVLFGHLGMNLFDDYFDYREKAPNFGIKWRVKESGQGLQNAAILRRGRQPLHSCGWLVWCSLSWRWASVR